MGLSDSKTGAVRTAVTAVLCLLSALIIWLSVMAAVNPVETRCYSVVADGYAEPIVVSFSASRTEHYRYQTIGVRAVMPEGTVAGDNVYPDFYCGDTLLVPADSVAVEIGKK